MTTREERLDALAQAVTDWADKRKEAYEYELAFLQSVFAGRTNDGRLADMISTEVSALLEDSINDFLA